MSFYGLISDAKAVIHEVEVSLNIGHSHGMATSPLHKGTEHPGGAAMHAKPAKETQHVGRLRAGIKTPKTRTDSLTRKYPESA